LASIRVAIDAISHAQQSRAGCRKGVSQVKNRLYTQACYLRAKLRRNLHNPFEQ